MNDAEDRTALYDLHLHTYWSYDATPHPETHFKRARELGVGCIAIADHHVLDSLEEVLAIAEDYPDIRAIPSAELTVTTSIGSVDLLCYGFPQAFSGDLQKVLDTYHAWQRAAGQARSEGLQALGHHFTDAHRLELLQSYRPAGVIDLQGNTHVKNQILQSYFVKRGFIASANEYTDLLNRAREKVPFPPYPNVEDVIPVVKRVGARVAIAHPFGYFNGHDIPRMDTLVEECRLDGIECAHKGVPPDYMLRYRKYCVQHGLFSTGGSDCHSDEDIQSIFARHGGPNEWLDELLDRLDNA